MLSKITFLELCIILWYFSAGIILALSGRLKADTRFFQCDKDSSFATLTNLFTCVVGTSAIYVLLIVARKNNWLSDVSIKRAYRRFTGKEQYIDVKTTLLTIAWFVFLDVLILPMLYYGTSSLHHSTRIETEYDSQTTTVFPTRWYVALCDVYEDDIQQMTAYVSRNTINMLFLQLRSVNYVLANMIGLRFNISFVIVVLELFTSAYVLIIDIVCGTGKSGILYNIKRLCCCCRRRRHRQYSCRPHCIKEE